MTGQSAILTVCAALWRANEAQACRADSGKARIIVFDEPTNHLDLHTREMLEQALTAYQGTLLLVSHDLYFLQTVCDKVLIFDQERIRRLEYSFAEYVERADLG